VIVQVTTHEKGHFVLGKTPVDALQDLVVTPRGEIAREYAEVFPLYAQVRSDGVSRNQIPVRSDLYSSWHKNGHTSSSGL
jgi:hypothetical protein